MTVKEIYDQLDSFDDDGRQAFLCGLSKKLSSLSIQTLRKFQDEWDYSKSHKAFFKA